MIVLDTNVLSELMSSSPNPAVRHWLAQRPSAQLFTTSISMAEILQGIELLPRGKRRDGLVVAAQTMFTALFPGRVLPFHEDAARAFAPIAANRRTRGRPIASLTRKLQPSPKLTARLCPPATPQILKTVASAW